MTRIAGPMKRPSLRIATGLFALMLGLMAGAAYAADDPGVAVVVNSTGLNNDSNFGDGVCSTGNTVGGQPECTLRAAIQETNNSATLDRIHFSIPQTDGGWNGSTFVITLTTNLPGIGSDTEISGDTQPEFAGSPVVEIHNDGANPQAHAFRFSNAAGAGVEHLAVFGFGDGTNIGAIRVDNSSNVVVAENYIGVHPGDPTDSAFGNSAFAIQVSGSTGTAVSGNVIGHNTLGGIDVSAASIGTTIDGNFIGVTPSGTAIVNLASGIAVSAGSDNTSIGAVNGNIISHNVTGVSVSDSANALVVNNTIGLSPDRQAPAGNRNGVVFIASDGMIGDRARPNFIGDNLFDGIRIDNATASIEGNYIGTNTSYANLGHGDSAIALRDANSTIIEANIIGFSGAVSPSGAVLVSGTSTGITIGRNYIGVTPDNANIGNFNDGIVISQDPPLGVASTLAVTENMIGNNWSNGISILSATEEVVIGNNFIGTNSGGVDLANGDAGIAISSTTAPVSITGNTIANNTTDGVRFDGGGTDSPVRVSQNSIYDNGELAFDLGTDEVTPNDAGDGDSGPNGLLNYPVIDAITPSGPIDLVTVTLDAPTAVYNVEFYQSTTEDPSGHGEAETYLGTLGGVFVAGPTTIDWATPSLTPGGSISALLIEPSLGATSELSAAFTVGAAPILQPISDQANAEGDTVTLDVVANDPDGGTITFAAAGLPDGLAINANTGRISGTVTHDNTSNGLPIITSVTITATDDGTPNLTATQTFDWTVTDTNRAPTLNLFTDQVSTEGDAISLNAIASDPDGDTLVYFATDLPHGLSIGVLTGEVTGTLPADAANNSPYAVTIATADDDDPALTDTATFTWSVLDVNRPPSLTVLADQINDENDTVSLATVASDPDGDVLTYTATGLPDGLAIDRDTGVIAGTLTFNAAEVSVHAVTVVVSDGGFQQTTTFTWIVNSLHAPPTTTTPVSSTTTAPPTTTAPTTAAPTTTAPTTAAPTTTAPTTAPTTTAPTTTTPTTTAPDAIPFTAESEQTPPASTAPTPTGPPTLRAVSDTFTQSSSTAQNFDLLANDDGGGTGSIVAITQPDAGAARIVGSATVEVTLPESFAGSVTFVYELVDETGAVSSATVTVESLNVLYDVSELVTTSRAELTSVDGVVDRVQLLFAELLQIRLNAVELTALSLTPFLLAALHLALRATDRLVEVTGLRSRQTLETSSDTSGSTTRLRHDALVWTTMSPTLRRRKATRVDLPNGQTARIPNDRLADTGF